MAGEDLSVMDTGFGIGMSCIQLRALNTISIRNDLFHPKKLNKEYHGNERKNLLFKSLPIEWSVYWVGFDSFDFVSIHDTLFLYFDCLYTIFAGRKIIPF